MAAIALVTGASGGLGQALVRELRREGWTVALAGRSLERLQTAFGVEALCIEADVSTPEGARLAVESCQREAGLPTALAQCAGTTLLSPLHRTTAEMYRACVAANLDSAFFMLGAFVDALREARQPGAAVLVSSVVARIGVANHEAIAAAEAGIEGLVRSAAATYAPSRIRVNAVAPGPVWTPLNPADKSAGDVAAFGEDSDMGRPAQPEEISPAYVFLASPVTASYVNGVVLPVMGGPRG